MKMKQICHCMLLSVLIGIKSPELGNAFDLRLYNGSSPNEGTVELKAANGHWFHICGQPLDISDVMVICRQLGFPGANRFFRRSPFGSESPTLHLQFNCTGDEPLIDDCGTTPSCSGETTMGAAICHERRRPRGRKVVNDQRYIGCFNDNATNRVLPCSMKIDNNMTIGKCIEHCMASADSGVYMYAGLELGNECYCGDNNADYGRLGRVGEHECQFACLGDITSSCGGIGKIAIFNISVTISAVSTDITGLSTPTPGSNALNSTHGQTTNQETISVSGGGMSMIAKQSPGPVLTSVVPSKPVDAGNIALYAGAGGGGTFLLILIIVVIVVLSCRRRENKKGLSSGEQSKTRIGSGNDGRDLGYVDMSNINKNKSSTEQGDRSPSDGPDDKDSYYLNKGTELERDYQNANELDERKYVNLSEAMNNKETSYMNMHHKSSLEQPTPDPVALYAMPDLSDESTSRSTRPMTYTSPNEADGPSLMYAMPGGRAKTVYSSMGKPSSEEEDNLDTLYATSTKSRLKPIGMEASGDEKNLYALPDKNRRDQSGAGKRDAVEAMYAIPDKSHVGNDVDNSIMIENDIYSST